MNQIDQYLLKLLEKEGSDLHFLAGGPARIRVNGDLTVLDEATISQTLAETALMEIMPFNARETMEQRDGADFAYQLENVGRFRVNVFKQRGDAAMVIQDAVNFDDAGPGTCLIWHLSFEEIGRASCRERV